MSEKDRLLLADGQCESHLRVIANGVDLVRFQPSPEPPGRRLLFVASFAHYPNMVAYRFLLREVWPLLAPGTALTVVAGRNPEEAWRAFTGETAIPAPAGVEVHHFVAQVEGLYRQCNLVVVPTLVSAGTNLKVLEAMAAGRAIVSTPSGCAGLGLTDGKELRIITGAPAFAGTIDELLGDAAARSRLASAARATAEERFGWEALGRAQREVWRELLR
jgi:glycosyltransferase involved in cell wall biosynthesis